MVRLKILLSKTSITIEGFRLRPCRFQEALEEFALMMRGGRLDVLAECLRAGRSSCRCCLHWVGFIFWGGLQEQFSDQSAEGEQQARVLTGIPEPPKVGKIIAQNL